MTGCCAVGCKSKSEDGFKLYLIPSGKRNEARRKLWLARMKRLNFSSDHSRLCEVHFEEDQFEPLIPRKLKPNAVPTIFIDSHSRKRLSLPRKRSDSPQADSVPQTLIPQHDHSYCENKRVGMPDLESLHGEYMQGSGSEDMSETASLSSGMYNQAPSCGRTLQRRNPEFVQKWVCNIGKENSIPSSRSDLCSVHIEGPSSEENGHTIRGPTRRKGARTWKPSQKWLLASEVRKKYRKSFSSSGIHKQTQKSPLHARLKGSLETVVKYTTTVDENIEQDSYKYQVFNLNESNLDILKNNPAHESPHLLLVNLPSSKDVVTNRKQNGSSVAKNNLCAVKQTPACCEELTPNQLISDTSLTETAVGDDPAYQSFLLFSASMAKSKEDIEKSTMLELPTVNNKFHRRRGLWKKKYEVKCKENEELRRHLISAYQRIRQLTNSMNDLVKVIEGLDRDLAEDIGDEY